MTKRTLIITVLFLLTALIMLSVVILRGRDSVLADPYKFIPENAVIIIESHDISNLTNDLTSGNGLFRELSEIREAGIWSGNLKEISSILNNTAVRPLLENNKVLISLHPGQGNRLVPLIVFNMPTDAGRRQVREIFWKIVGDSLMQIMDAGQGIYGIVRPGLKTRDTIFYSFSGRIIRCSVSPSLLRSSGNLVSSGRDILNHKGIEPVMNISGKGQSNKLFLIFSNLQPYLKKILAGRHFPQYGYSGVIADVAGGDIFVDGNGLVLSGYMVTTDSSHQMYGKQTVPQGICENHRFLPSDVLLFETTIINPEKIDRNYLKKQSADSAEIGILLLPCFSGEVTKAMTGNSGNGTEESWLYISKLKNRDLAERIVTGMSGKKYSENLQDTWVRYFRPDEQTSIAVYSTPFSNIIGGFMDQDGREVKDTLVTFYDSYMISSNSGSAIEDFLYSNIRNKTLGNNIAFREFEKTLPSRTGYYFYCVPAGIVNWLSGYLNDSISSALKRNITALAKIEAIGYQYASSNNMIYNTLSVKYEENRRDDSGAEWATLLDTAASVKPFFFTNHNTGAKEIFIQDYKNNVYLINSAGRVLWKVQIGERILGNVFMIDFYRNGKYQILFSGKNRLHLLDRNGNYVERYPVTLRSPASGPAALFDYEGTRDYRIFVPGEDRRIYAYDKTGGAVKGWNPFRTTGYVKMELRLFRVSGKDYIVASDEHTVYFLDRTGNIRLKTREPVIRARGSEMRIDPSGGQSVVFSSPDGVVQTVSFTGNVKRTELGKFSADHSFDFFDIDSDGRGEYLFIDKGILYLFDDDRREIFRKEFGTALIEGPINFTFTSAEKRTGIFDRSNRLIYVIDRDGNTEKGFPLRGASLFSIGKMGGNDYYNLIVGGDDNFLYNYRINIETN